MGDAYLVSKWALIRRNELVDIPDQLEIHPDFLQILSHAEFESAFREIGEMFRQMYSDIADFPQKFGLPLYKIDEYDYFSNQARTVPWNLGAYLEIDYPDNRNVVKVLCAIAKKVKNTQLKDVKNY